MLDKSVLLLAHYTDPEESQVPLLRYMIKNWLGIYLPWDLYLVDPLNEIFSGVTVYDYLQKRAEIGIKEINQEIIAIVKDQHPDYVVWVSWQYDILPATFEAIRKEGAVVIGFFFDDDWRFENYSKWWIPYLDYVVTHGHTSVAKYEALGSRVIPAMLNTGASVEVDWENLKEKYDVSFVGSKFSDRAAWLTALQERNIPVAAFGAGWGGYVSFEDMLDTFTTSKINLNFSGTYFQALHMKGRIFQVCLAGGFLLTEYAPEIENYFVIDKEIVCFQDIDELTDKLHYYINHEDERRAIAKAGWERARKEYSSSAITADIFRQIEEDLASRGRNETLPQIRMPFSARLIPSQYFFQWARAEMKEEYAKGHWKESLELSFRYNPFNIWARYQSMASHCPPPIRKMLFRLYDAAEAAPRVVYRWLCSIPLVGRIAKAGFVKKLIVYLKM